MGKFNRLRVILRTGSIAKYWDQPVRQLTYLKNCIFKLHEIFSTRLIVTVAQVSSDNNVIYDSSCVDDVIGKHIFDTARGKEWHP